MYKLSNKKKDEMLFGFIIAISLLISNIIMYKYINGVIKTENDNITNFDGIITSYIIRYNNSENTYILDLFATKNNSINCTHYDYYENSKYNYVDDIGTNKLYSHVTWFKIANTDECVSTIKQNIVIHFLNILNISLMITSVIYLIFLFYDISCHLYNNYKAKNNNVVIHYELISQHV